MKQTLKKSFSVLFAVFTALFMCLASMPVLGVKADDTHMLSVTAGDGTEITYDGENHEQDILNAITVSDKDTGTVLTRSIHYVVSFTDKEGNEIGSSSDPAFTDPGTVTVHVEGINEYKGSTATATVKIIDPSPVTHTVVFYSDGAFFNDTAVGKKNDLKTSLTVTVEDQKTLSEVPESAMDKTDFATSTFSDGSTCEKIFIGWFTSMQTPTGYDVYNHDGRITAWNEDERYDFSEPVTDDLYLYAVWYNGDVNISFITSYGDPVQYENTLGYAKIPYNTPVSDPGPCNPREEYKDRYVFDAWYRAKGGMYSTVPNLEEGPYDF